MRSFLESYGYAPSVVVWAIDKAGVSQACIDGDRPRLARALRRLRSQSRKLGRLGRNRAQWVGWPLR